MKWKKFTIDTTTEGEDIVSSLLTDFGIESIEIEDHVPVTPKETKGVYMDILPDNVIPDDGRARVSFYLDSDMDSKEVLANVKAELASMGEFCDLGSCEISESETEDVDWVNNWKKYFHPFTVDKFLIKPSWEDIPAGDEDKTLIEIDPGTAFGTGSHETTQLCIRQLAKFIKAGDKVLDVGTGSGILSIAAIKLGAVDAIGTDLDESAVAAAIENAERNGISGAQFPVLLGDIIDDTTIQERVGFEKYDVAVANILAQVIIMLSGEIDRHIKPGGILITSGIINTWEERVKEAFAKRDCFELIETTYQGEWVSITYKKKA